MTDGAEEMTAAASTIPSLAQRYATAFVDLETAAALDGLTK